MCEVSVRNRDRGYRIDLELVKAVALDLLRRSPWHPEEAVPYGFELGIEFLPSGSMAQVNQNHLGHAGSTDVITFDYGRIPGSDSARTLHCGEIMICPEVAVAQGRQFGTTWQTELARYLIHGILHLHGYDDQTPQARRVMKRAESRLLRETLARFAIRGLGVKRRSPKV